MTLRNFLLLVVSALGIAMAAQADVTTAKLPRTQVQLSVGAGTYIPKPQPRTKTSKLPTKSSIERKRLTKQEPSHQSDPIARVARIGVGPTPLLGYEKQEHLVEMLESRVMANWLQQHEDEAWDLLSPQRSKEDPLFRVFFRAFPEHSALRSSAERYLYGLKSRREIDATANVIKTWLQDGWHRNGAKHAMNGSQIAPVDDILNRILKNPVTRAMLKDPDGAILTHSDPSFVGPLSGPGGGGGPPPNINARSGDAGDDDPGTNAGAGGRGPVGPGGYEGNPYWKNYQPNPTTQFTTPQGRSAFAVLTLYLVNNICPFSWSKPTGRLQPESMKGLAFIQGTFVRQTFVADASEQSEKMLSILWPKPPQGFEIQTACFDGFNIRLIGSARRAHLGTSKRIKLVDRLNLESALDALQPPSLVDAIQFSGPRIELSVVPEH